MHHHIEHQVTPPKRFCGGCSEVIIAHTIKDIFIPGIGGIKICEKCYAKIEDLLPDLKNSVEKERTRIRSYPSPYDYGPHGFVRAAPPKQKMVLRYRPKESEPEETEQTPEGG